MEDLKLKAVTERELMGFQVTAVQDLQNMLYGVDLKTMSSDNIIQLICYLDKLISYPDFSVSSRALNTLALLVVKLDQDVEQYFTQIVDVSMKTLDDPKKEPFYTSILLHLMRTMKPDTVLILLSDKLLHHNPTVREAFIKIIIAYLLSYETNSFNIAKLCYICGPRLVDLDMNVRHATLELFALFYSCLKTNKNETISTTVRLMELIENIEGLMDAVKTRICRGIFPEFKAHGTVNYALKLPEPGQHYSGPDLEWILNKCVSNPANKTQDDIQSILKSPPPVSRCSPPWTTLRNSFKLDKMVRYSICLSPTL